MSRLRSDKLVNRAGTAAPELTYGASVPVGYAITGAGSINLTGVSTLGSLSSLTVTNDATVGGALTVTGNFTVNGTTTTIDTVNLVIEDKNIGIGTTSSASNTTADGARFTIFGGSGGDKTLTWER